MSRFVRSGRRLSVTAVALAGVLMGRPGHGAELKLPDTTYTYTVVDQDLAAALQEFGANENLRIKIGPEVKGRIQGRIPGGTPRDFLDRLATIYNFEWYFDGTILHVTSAKENRTQLLALGPVPYDAFRLALDALRISDSRFPLRPTPAQGAVMVSGPPSYVMLVEQTLAGLIAERQSPPPAAPLPSLPRPRAAAGTVLTVFRGSSATIVRDGCPEATTSPRKDQASSTER